MIARMTLGSNQGEFRRRCKYGIQTAGAFLFGAFITYGTSLSTSLSTPYLVPIMATLLCQQTIGMTLLASLSLAVSVTPFCILFYLLQKGIGYHDIASIAPLIFFTVWFASYRNPSIAQRKIPTIIVVIFFTALCNTPDALLSSVFAFQLLAALMVGVAVALASALVVLPTSAIVEVHERFLYCLQGVERANELTIAAFVCHCCDEDEAESGQQQQQQQHQHTKERCQAKRIKAAADFDHIFPLLRDARTSMKALLLDTKGELVPVVQKLTGRPLTPAREVHLTTQLLFFLSAARSQLKGSLCHHHSRQQRMACQPLIEWRAQLSALLSCIRFDDSLSKLEDRFHAMQEANQLLTRLENEMTTAQSSDWIVSSSPLSRTGTHDPQKSRPSTATSRSIHGEQTEIQVAAQCLTYCLLQLSETVLLYYSSLKHVNTPYDIDATKKLPLPSKGHVSFGRRLLSAVWPLDIPLLVSSLRSAIIIGVGSVFVLVPSLAARFEEGTWILVAMCMTQGNTQGGAYLTMRNRLFGTLLGSVYGYLCYLAVGTSTYHFFAMMVPWILVCTYARFCPSWSYAGTIAIITPIVIILGNTVGQFAPENFAILRIEENVLGILLGAALNLLLFPISAADSLNIALSKAMEQAELATDSTITLCQSLTAPSQPVHERKEQREGNEAEKEADGEGGADDPASVDRLLLFVGYMDEQRPLMDEAAAEPRFFVGCFPLTHYRSAWTEQQKLIGCLFLIQRLLKRLRIDGQRNTAVAARLRSKSGVALLTAIHSSLAACKATFALWRVRAHEHVVFSIWMDREAAKDRHPALTPQEAVGDSAAVLLTLVRNIQKLRSAHVTIVQRMCMMADEGATGGGRNGNGDLGARLDEDEVRSQQMLTVLGQQVQKCVQLCSELSSHLKRALEVNAGYGREPEEAQQWLILPY